MIEDAGSAHGKETILAGDTDSLPKFGTGGRPSSIEFIQQPAPPILTITRNSLKSREKNAQGAQKQPEQAKRKKAF